MRNAELSSQRRRRLGLEFWNAYPTDPRRFKWLTITTHLPPYYPKDIDTWIDNQITPGRPVGEIDETAITEWDIIYPTLRDEFWDSAEVSDEERRYLWFGELHNELRRARDDIARSAPTDSVLILQKITQFMRTFPDATNENDKSTHQSQLRSLVSEVIVNSRALNLEVADIDRFAERVRAISQDVADAFNMATTVLVIMGVLPDSDGFEVVTPKDLSDEHWRDARRVLGNPASTSLEHMIIYWQNREVKSRLLRELGLRLWQSYPENRVHRMQWLYYTLEQEPLYLNDITRGSYLLAKDWKDWDVSRFSFVAVDSEARVKWSNEYQALRSSIWNSPDTTDDERVRLRINEVRNHVMATRLEVKGGDASGVQDLLDDIHGLYTEYGEGFFARRLAAGVIQDHVDFGIDETTLASFVAPMSGYEYEPLRYLAEGWKRTKLLRTTPLELRAITLDGRPFDLADFRGKIVLVDYWTTNCASCIAAMPMIHDVYEEYKARGFEVVSVSFDAEQNRKKVERIENEMGLTWTTLVADSIWEETNARFGFGNIVPQYMLLDRNGYLVAGTSEIDSGKNLEALLEEMLTAEDAEKKETATVH